MKKRIGILVLCLGLLASCNFVVKVPDNNNVIDDGGHGQDPTPDPEPEPDPDPQPDPDPEPDPDPVDENHGDIIPDDFKNMSYNDVFNSKNAVEVHLNFKKSVLEALEKYQANARDSKYYDLYFPVDLEIAVNDLQATYLNVGVRIKGNTSRHSFTDGETIYNPIHFKVSLKERFQSDYFDEQNDLKEFKYDYSEDPTYESYLKDRNFLGLEKFDLKFVPRNQTNFCAQEIYAYNLFNKEGIYAPMTNLVNVKASSKSMSYDYTAQIVETVDKQFLKRRFSKNDAKGDLYKCTWGKMGPADLSKNDTVNNSTGTDGLFNGSRIEHGKIGVEDNYTNYHPSYDLKTNDDGENSDFSKMQNYVNAISNVLNKNQGMDYLEQYLDIDQFLKFSAISDILGNPDDQRHNANNYYIYFVPSTGKAIYIPYDWDWCLGVSYSEDFSYKAPFDQTCTSSNGMNRVYNATIFYSGSAFNNDSYRRKYLDYINEAISNGALDIENYVSLRNDLGGQTEGEIDSVSNYMTNKKNVISNNQNI